MLSETWLSDDAVLAALSIPVYNFFFKNRIERRVGGVAAYVRNNYSEVRFDFELDPINDSLFFTIKVSNTSYAFGVLYSSSNTNISNFVEFLDSVLSYVCWVCDYVVCLSNFNIILLIAGCTLSYT